MTGADKITWPYSYCWYWWAVAVGKKPLGKVAAASDSYLNALGSLFSPSSPFPSLPASALECRDEDEEGRVEEEEETPRNAISTYSANTCAWL